MKQRLYDILERWFLKEPPLFQVLCLHELKANPEMACPMRCGHRALEYNPDYLGQMSDEAVEEAMRCEAVRILLKHPYSRKPEQCCSQAAAVGSNLVIGDNYTHRALQVEKPSDYGLPANRPYEWYARKIQELMPPGNGNGEGQGDTDDRSNGGQGGSGDPRQKRLEEQRSRNNDQAALWDDDEMTVALINGVIESCRSWGSLPGKLAEILKASTKARINWHHVFGGFRASVLSNRRKLTRMRPNRRSGFANMGSLRQFNTRLLIAVDVSGSISSTCLSWFYGVVNSIFRYGFESVDVAQFDCGVRSLTTLKKAMRQVTAVGRGGTNFQEVVDYAEEQKYDGLAIVTDGWAPPPKVDERRRCKILWICQDAQSYENHHSWMEKSGRVCTIDLTN